MDTLRLLATSRWHAAGEQLLCSFHFGFRDLPLAAASTAELACNFKIGKRSIHNQFPFHISQTCHHVEEEAAGGCASVNGMGQTLKLHSLLLELADEIDKVLEATAKPVQFPNDKGISRAKTSTDLSETRTFGSVSTHPIFEDFLTSSLLESLGLEFKILVLRRERERSRSTCRGSAEALR